MSKRTIFGGPSEIYPDVYPTHPPLVESGYGEHSAHNPDYYHYAGLGGGVAYAQEMPESAQRALAHNANEDMRESLERDNIPNKRQPGAMGSYWVPGAVRRDASDEDEDSKDNVKQGRQMYVGSSMKQKQKGECEVALESNLHDQLAGKDDELPVHRRRYQCAEPGLISEHRYENDRDYDGKEDDDGEKGGRFYVEDQAGSHLPPCGHGSEYGCAKMCNITGDEDIADDSY